MIDLPDLPFRLTTGEESAEGEEFREQIEAAEFFLGFEEALDAFDWNAVLFVLAFFVAPDEVADAETEVPRSETISI